jgi:prepilin-type N-terminal cleavage/methylation domain-containing protein
MRPGLRNDRGFTLTELMLTIAVLGTIAAMALPVMTDVTASVKLNEATRTVERELQSARLKSVTTNRLLRVKLNCPAVGYLRTVEVMGTTADNATDRCLQTMYPFPPADTEMTTLPNLDGPVKSIPNGATVGTLVLEFSPDGTVQNVVSGTPQTIATPLTITVTRGGKSKTMTVNGIGKIQLQ